MWLFKSKKSLRESGMFAGFTDWHSHILPGVDDGIKTLEDSIRVLDTYDKLGVKRVWLTPHIMEDYPNSTDELRAGFEYLKKNWTGYVELRLASENMIDNLFEERLERGDLLPIGDNGDHLLVETSYFTPPIEFDEVWDKIRHAGYFPVLAHPERYRYMEEKDYSELKNKGVLFQCNFVSLVGGYGKTAEKKAEWLLSRGMVDFFGSDIHRHDVFENIIESAPSKSSIIDNMLKIISRQEML